MSDKVETSVIIGGKKITIQSTLSKFPYRMSIGYNCYMKMYLSLNKVLQATNYFDYVGSSMWSLVELFENDFEGHIDPKNIEYVDPTPDGSLFVNVRYYVRFLHDFRRDQQALDQIPKRYFEEFQNKYKRRFERLIEILRDLNKPILFMRFEETFELERKLYGPIANVYPSIDKGKEALSDFEMENLIKFYSILKTKFSRNNFATIYVSHTKSDQIDLENNTVILYHDRTNLDWKDAAKAVESLFLEKEDLLINGLTQILSKIERNEIDEDHNK